MAEHSGDHNPLSHVLDSTKIELPWWSSTRDYLYTYEIELPRIGPIQTTRFMGWS